MFKLFLLITSFLSVFSADTLRKRTLTTFLNEGDEWKQFTNFQERFSKKYDSIQELENRFQIFETNIQLIIINVCLLYLNLFPKS